jgi:hypothetical protein
MATALDALRSLDLRYTQSADAQLSADAAAAAHDPEVSLLNALKESP